MPTAKDILAGLRFEKWAGSSDGACFGVADASRLRPALDQPIPQLRLSCVKCIEGKHDECEKTVELGILSTPIPCGCYRCRVVEEQPAQDSLWEAEPATKPLSSCDGCGNG
jgi:hypothetical protein